MNDSKIIPGISLLRAIALVVIVIAAAGSVWLTLYMGRKNSSILLIALFVFWVLSPFVALFVADRISKSWNFATRVLLYVLMFLVSIVSLAAYSGLLHVPDTKPAFMFLMMPLLSWFLIAIFVAVATLLSRKITGRKQRQ